MCVCEHVACAFCSCGVVLGQCIGFVLPFLVPRLRAFCTRVFFIYSVCAGPAVCWFTYAWSLLTLLNISGRPRDHARCAARAAWRWGAHRVRVRSEVARVLREQSPYLRRSSRWHHQGTQRCRRHLPRAPASDARILPGAGAAPRASCCATPAPSLPRHGGGRAGRCPRAAKR